MLYDDYMFINIYILNINVCKYIHTSIIYIYIIHIPDAETEYVCGMKTEDDLSNI